MDHYGHINSYVLAVAHYDTIDLLLLFNVDARASNVCTEQVFALPAK